MSDQVFDDSIVKQSGGMLERMLAPEVKDLGGFSVKRVLPAAARRMVGPFIFFDHFGPAEFPPGEGIQVRPHPHIGLSTVSYLFEGEIIHRDSLGFVQPIQSGAVNLMTAGSGIVHSERAGEDLHSNSQLHGIQSWMALPLEYEEIEPAFQHYPASDLVSIDIDSVTVRVIMGEAFGVVSPVTCYCPTLYLECLMPADSELRLPHDYDELAIYLVEGQVAIDRQLIEPGLMAVAAAGKPLLLRAKRESRVMVIGGATLGKRHIWWNYVSSSKARIEQAKDDWRENRFAAVPGETEFIPLP